MAQMDAPAELGWIGYATQSFYHMSAVPLLAVTCALAYAARPKLDDRIPDGFKEFAGKYLIVWAVCVAADWLQGPYVYALYAAYGFSSEEIAQLFVAGFGSSMVFGSFVGVVTDKFGRKKSSILYCVMYIISCMTKHFKNYQILMVGRITGGIATSLLFSSFECWMVSEHNQRHNFSGSLLGYMFGMMFTVMYIVAIMSGLVGQAVADSFVFGPTSPDGTFYTGGYCCPFDVAILCLLVGMGMMIAWWDENYGHREATVSEKVGGDGFLTSLYTSVELLKNDRRVLLLGMTIACFEGSMYAFVFNWTPALKSTEIPPPHGVIFAMFMMACMCGASTSTLVGNEWASSARLSFAFAVGLMAFVLASFAVDFGAEDHLRTCLFAFLAFEYCVGVYFPSVGVFKSEVVPEEVRGTVYNLYRVPLNGIVVFLLLSGISMSQCFKLNALLLFGALTSTLIIAQNYNSPGVRGLPTKQRSRGDVEMAQDNNNLFGNPKYDAVPGTDEEGTVIGRRALPSGPGDGDDLL